MLSQDQEIPLSRPDITQAEIDLVVQTLKSGRLSLGPMQEKFELMVADRAGREHAVAVCNGTAGLHLALLALGIGPGDEVVTTPFSFIASSNAILYVGATPVFVDIHPRSLNLDPQKAAAAITPRTKAILGVEAFGNPAHMPELAAIAARHEIPLVEDSCEGLGGSINGRRIGDFGRVSVFAFYPNKQITTGEGGMIVTDDERLANLCRSLRNQGRPVTPSSPSTSSTKAPPTHSPTAASHSASASSAAAETSHPGAGSWLTHERLGYNYRLTEIHAALGVAQMRRLDDLIEKRACVAERYVSRLLGHPDLTMPTIDPGTMMSWFVFVVRLASDFSGDQRDRILLGMKRHDVGVGNYFPPIHLQRFYRERFGFKPGSFPITESVSQRTIALPFHSRLTDREIDLVCQTLELMIQRETFGRRGGVANRS